MKILKQNYYRHPLKITFLYGFILGSIVYLIIYGWNNMIFTNINYLANERRDLSQHYFGWAFYRYSSWKYGLGALSTACYPKVTSIINTDSNAIVAFVLKLFSGCLPKDFQYVGFCGFLAFALQGGFSSTLLRKLVNNNIIATILSIPFILSPPMYIKLFYHHALGNHWLIVLALVIWVYKKDECSEKKLISALKPIGIWFIMGFLVMGIHPYIVPMVGMILLGYTINTILDTHKFLTSLFKLFSYLGGSLFFWAIMGGWYALENSDVEKNVHFLYSLGANLNTYFNSWGISRFGPTFPVLENSGQGEGIAYLGMGMILLLVVAFFINIKRFIFEQSKSDIWTAHFLISLLLVWACSFIVSLGPTVSLNGIVLFTIPYPDRLIRFWSNFRSTGRMIWPSIYIIYFLTYRRILLFLKYKKKDFRIVGYMFIFLCVLIQIIDLTPRLLDIHKKFSHEKMNSEFETCLKDKNWNIIASKYAHLVVLPNKDIEHNIENAYVYDFAYLATEHNITLNDFYFSRQNYIDQTPYYLNIINSDAANDDTAYIVTENLLPKIHGKVFIYKIDNFYLLTSKDISKELGER